MRIVPFLKNSKIVFAEVSAKHIKIFVFSRTRSRLLQYMELPFGDNLVATQELQKFSKKFRLRYTPLYVAVSQSIAINKYIELPSVDNKEIPELLKWQLPNLVFYPEEDILYSYKILRKNKSKSQIILFLVSKRLLMPYLQAFSKAGFNIEKIILSPEITAQWILDKMEDYGFRFPIAFINLDNYTGEISIVDNDGLVFARGFNVSDNEPIEQIVREIEISMDVYKKVPTASSISQIFLTGQEVICNAILPDLRKLFLVKPSFLRIKGALGFKKFDSKERSFAVAKQFSDISRMDFSMQFNPYEFLKSQEKRNALRDLTYTALLSLFLIILLIYHIVIQYKIRSNLNNLMQEKYSTVKVFSSKITKMKKLLDELNMWIPKSRLLYILNDISVAKIDKVYISMIVYKEEGTISIKGFANDLQSLFSFVDNLNHARHLKNCEIRYALKKKRDNVEQIDFQLLCKIKKKGG